MEIGIVSWIAVGLIAGILGKLIMPGRDPGGFLLTIVIRMLGALVGGLVMQLLGTRGYRTYGVQHLVYPGGHPWSNHIAGDILTVRGFSANLKNSCAWQTGT